MDVKVGADHSLQIAPLDEADFRIASRDVKGHSEPVQYRTQPGIVMQINNLIHSRRFPLRNPSEFHRLADVLLLHALESMCPGMVSILSTIDINNTIIQQDEYYQDSVAMFEKLNKRVTEHMGRGARGEAIRLIMQVLDNLKKMPEGYWKDYYLNKINENWGGLIAEAGSVNLNKEFIDVGETT